MDMPHPVALDQVLNFERSGGIVPLNTVFLNVFDLSPELSVPNAILCNNVFSTLGAFHTAVEVFAQEWSFYQSREEAAQIGGICNSALPRQHGYHVYRQSINLGVTALDDFEVQYLIHARLAPDWPGDGYDLLHRNCIHFCNELCLSLGVKEVPSWVRGLHETGATVLRIPWPISMLVDGGGGEEVEQTRRITDEAAIDHENEHADPSASSTSEPAPSISVAAAASSDAPRNREASNCITVVESIKVSRRERSKTFIKEPTDLRFVDILPEDDKDETVTII